MGATCRGCSSGSYSQGYIATLQSGINPYFSDHIGICQFQQTVPFFKGFIKQSNINEVRDIILNSLSKHCILAQSIVNRLGIYIVILIHILMSI